MSLKLSPVLFQEIECFYEMCICTVLHVFVVSLASLVCVLRMWPGLVSHQLFYESSRKHFAAGCTPSCTVVNAH